MNGQRRQVGRLIDEQIAAKAAGGDRKAFEQLCALTWRQLYQFVYHKVQNREEAEDVTQEAYSRTLRALPSGYSAGKFMAYLQRVAMNVIRDQWRKAQTRDRSRPLIQPELTEPDAAEGVADRDLVEQVLQRLPDAYRQVLTLRIMMGLSTAQTAERMGRTEAAVRTLQYRAVQALKEEIA
jgi:RNA polymerase sigma-70 factor, ECF subfamily